MNRLEEIQEIIKNFIYEKQQMKQQIAEIERKRTELAQERNEKKRINENANNAYANNSEAKINELGKQISELGNQSQELQNKLDSKYNETKTIVNSGIDNLIAEKIRKIKIIEEERQELEESIISQKEKSAKYEIQKQEFYARFGRMPELSQNAIQNIQLNQNECELTNARIIEIDEQIENAKNEIQQLAKTKKEFKEGKWAEITAIEEDVVRGFENSEESTLRNIIEEVEETKSAIQEVKEVEEESITLPLMVEENIETDIAEEKIDVIEENKQIEEINIEEFTPIEEIAIDEFVPIEEIEVEEIEPIEEFQVQEMEPIAEIDIEPVGEIQPIEVEEFATTEEISPKENTIREFKVFGIDEEDEELQQMWQVEDDEIEENVQQIEKQAETEQTKTVEQIDTVTTEKTEIIEQEEKVDEIEELAKSIIEEIAEEQAKYPSIEKEQQTTIENIVEERQEEQEIIAYEEKREDKKTITPMFDKKITLQNIIAKFENGDVLYKAQASNGDEIKVYPTKASTGNLLLKDKENREELKEILINYAVAEYKTLDKKVIRKIDPTVCEILVTFAKKYNYDAQNLIYNYAMSFSKNEESEIDSIPTITYNISYMEGTNLSKKEKEILSKICKNARKNERIDIIGHITGFSKIRYIFKRTFAANNANALPEAKY